MQKITFAAVAACALAAGCAGTPQEAANAGNPYPADYKRLAAAYVRETFLDPYSIRDAEIAAPKLAMGPGLLGDGSFATPWVVCVRANAKNRMGAYTGRTATGIQVYRGKAVGAYGGPATLGTSTVDAGELACGGASYAPFPEINGKA
jgi:hypothetical protein